jgi:hypothetical protein
VGENAAGLGLVNPASVVTQEPIFEPSCSILDQVVLAPPAPLCDPKKGTAHQETALLSMRNAVRS